MADEVLEEFGKRKRFNILELALKLQVDRNQVKEALDNLVGLGKLRVEKKKLHANTAPMSMVLGCRCSIRGSFGETYVLNE